LLVGEDLTDITGRVEVVDLPPRRPWGVAGAHIDAQSTGWTYNQEAYIAESPESASRVLHQTYQEAGLPEDPVFGDESRVWTTADGHQFAFAWIRKGPAATVLRLQSAGAVTRETAHDKALGLARNIAAKLDACSTFVQAVTPSPGPDSVVTIEIIARDNIFEPTGITVSSGASVLLRLKNEGRAIHNMHIVGPENRFSEKFCEGLADPCLDPSLVRSGQSASLTWVAPDKPGDVAFRCDLHPQEMTGTIKVQ
jgi:plastocyanin